MTTTRKCSVCGKQITEGYVFDGTDCFCSKECATDFFDNDEECVEILLDEGNRLVWMDALPTPPHYKVNIGYADTNDFHYCDTWQKVLDWLNTRVFVTIKTQQDIDAYNKQHKFAPIEVILFEPKDYYDHRRQYVSKVRKCEDIMQRVQGIARSPKRDSLFNEFGRAYDDANYLWDTHPEVWQGEI